MTASFTSSAKVTSAVIVANLSVAIAGKVADDLSVPEDYTWKL
jgi:hypothetical protein